jgi:hypothetical protein
MQLIDGIEDTRGGPLRMYYNNDNDDDNKTINTMVSVACFH